jgi:hypothetical protein
MKLKNNLTREAFEESYRNQGYDEEQIEALMWMLDNELEVISLMSLEISGEHMNMLIELSEISDDIQDEYFFDDNTLDIEELEYAFSNFERYQYCSHSFW